MCLNCELNSCRHVHHSRVESYLFFLSKVTMALHVDRKHGSPRDEESVRHFKRGPWKVYIIIE